MRLATARTLVAKLSDSEFVDASIRCF